MVFGPAGAVARREDVDFGALAPVPLGVARVHRPGTDVTVVAVGHLVHDALTVADELAGTISVEVFDPRTLYPFDWAALAASLEHTGRLVVVDDSNRTCGIGGEILATAAEEMHLIAPPKRITRPTARCSRSPAISTSPCSPPAPSSARRSRPWPSTAEAVPSQAAPTIKVRRPQVSAACERHAAVPAAPARLVRQRRRPGAAPWQGAVVSRPACPAVLARGALRDRY
jgi:transketolase-like protein